VGEKGRRTELVGARGEKILEDGEGYWDLFPASDDPDTANANARLIRLSPELLEVVEAFDALIKYQYSGSREAMSALQDVAFRALDVLKAVKGKHPDAV
jgi:hypothetical protein